MNACLMKRPSHGWGGDGDIGIAGSRAVRGAGFKHEGSGAP
jgi:hypothetical protein